jgi:hypothetical protein
MESYLLLLREPVDLGSMSPEEMQAVIGRYKAWGQKLREAGRIAGSNKLEDGAGRVLRGSGAQMRITDGPYAETKDVVAGYYLILADSYEDAVEWSKDCPHLDFGAIEVRRIHVV